MRVFKLGNAIVVCESKSTRNGFKHTASLVIRGYEICEAKCMYFNRTWESYQYETVFHKVLDMTDQLTHTKKKRFIKKYEGR